MDLLKNIIVDSPKNLPLLGIDVGKKTLGIAVSDGMQSIAVPVGTIKRTKFSKDMRLLEAHIRDYEVCGVILGYPINMDGSEGPRCQSIRDFGLEMKNQISDDIKGCDGLWVGLWDERLSTAAVEDFVDNTVDISRQRAKDRGIIDRLAAQVILQGALDYIQANRY